MGINWPSVPIARITLAFASGIILGYLIDIDLPWATLPALLPAFILGLHWKRKPGIRYALAFTCWTVAGAWALQWHSSLHDEQYFAPDLSGEEVEVDGLIREISPGDDYTRVLIEVERHIQQDTAIPAQGQWMLWLQQKTQNSTLPMVNDRIRVKARPERPRPAMNPGAFDYRYYLWTRDIHRTAFVPHDQWNILGHTRPTGLLTYSREIKLNLLGILKRCIPGDESAAFAGALLLGHKEELSSELRSEFQQAGASHIMAVSGLHVGIIYSMIILVLSTLHRLIPIPVWGKSIVLLTGIWAFAFICGLPSSVCRAALMFSIWRLSKHTFATNQSFNAYFVAAFLLLLADPKSLFQVGFQFSFLAVAGILLVYPKLQSIWIPKSTVLNYAWQLVLVSASAQLFLLPLTAYYFGYCTLLSLLSSLIVIPAAYLILGLGILILCFAEIGLPLAEQIGWINQCIIDGTISCVSFIQSIPYGQWSIENLRLFDLMTISFSTACLIGLMLTQKTFYVRIAVMISLIIGTEHVISHIRDQKGCLQVLHHNELSIRWIQSGQQLHFDSDETKDHPNEIQLQSANFMLSVSKGKREFTYLVLKNHQPINVRAGTWIIDDVRPPEFDPNHPPARIILSKRLSYRRRKAWKSFARQLGISLYDIRTQGAFIDQNPLSI